MNVSPATEKALRKTMARLIAGQPRYTDGAFTKENLYKEAGVSRATMNRATKVMAEWDAHLAEHGRRTKGEARGDAELTEVNTKLKATRNGAAELRRKLDAAATIIAALHHDNQALREPLDSRRGGLADLATRREELRGGGFIGPLLTGVHRRVGRSPFRQAGDHPPQNPSSAPNLENLVAPAEKSAPLEVVLDDGA